MSIADLDVEPTAPNSTYVSIIAGLIRGLLQIASGLGFGWGAFVSGDQITMLATAAVMTGTLVWSAYQKIEAVRRTRRAVAVSAVHAAEATAAELTTAAVPGDHL